MTIDPGKEDRELEIWREEWSSLAPPSPEFHRQVQESIKAHDRRFWLSNLLAVAALVAMLILAVYQLSHPASRLERGSTFGLFALLFGSAACRLLLMQGTWRAETRSIRSFVELWQRRVLSQIRGLQIGIYISIGWLVFCAALAAINWAAVQRELMAHPAGCLALALIILLVLPLIWFGVMLLRRHRVAELNEVTRLLEEIDIMNG